MNFTMTWFQEKLFLNFYRFFTQWNQIFVCCLFHQNKPLILIAYKMCEKFGNCFSSFVKPFHFLNSKQGREEEEVLEIKWYLLFLKWPRFAKIIFFSQILYWEYNFCYWHILITSLSEIVPIFCQLGIVSIYRNSGNCWSSG